MTDFDSKIKEIIRHARANVMFTGLQGEDAEGNIEFELQSIKALIAKNKEQIIKDIENGSF